MAVLLLEPAFLEEVSYTYSASLKWVSLSTCSWGFPSELPRRLKDLRNVAVGVSDSNDMHLDLVLQLITAENISHVLIEPFDLVTCREGKVFRFLITKDSDLLSLGFNPMCRPYRHLAFRTESCHCIVGRVCISRRRILKISMNAL